MVYYGDAVSFLRSFLPIYEAVSVIWVASWQTLMQFQVKTL